MGNKEITTEEQLVKAVGTDERLPAWAQFNSSPEREKLLMAINLNGLPIELIIKYRELIRLGQTEGLNVGEITDLTRRYIAEGYFSPSLPATTGLENDTLGLKAIGSRRLLLGNTAEYFSYLAGQIIGGKLTDESIIKQLSQIWFVSADLCNTYGTNRFNPGLADHQIKRVGRWLKFLAGNSVVCREGDEFFAVVIADPDNFIQQFELTYHQFTQSSIKYVEDEEIKEGRVRVRAGAVNLLPILAKEIDGIEETTLMNQETTSTQKLFALLGLAITHVETRMKKMEDKGKLILWPQLSTDEEVNQVSSQLERIKAITEVISQQSDTRALSTDDYEQIIPREEQEIINRLAGSSLRLKEILLELARRACLDPLCEQAVVLTRRSFIRLVEQANQQNPITLIQINPELLKTFNDHYGHPAVDKILRVIADKLRKIAIGYGFEGIWVHRQGIKFWVGLTDAPNALTEKRVNGFIRLFEKDISRLRPIEKFNEEIRAAIACLILPPDSNIGSSLDKLYAMTKEVERENYWRYLITEPGRAAQIKAERRTTVEEWEREGERRKQD